MGVAQMNIEQIKQIIIRELPGILQQDPDVREFVLRLSRHHFADKAETESRFDRVLDELRQDREEQARKWEAQDKKWRENQAAQERKWEVQDKKWAENQAAINRMLQSIESLASKHDSTIGALGARWGLHTEASFRNALKGILEEFSGIEVINVVEYDDAGEVFGQPDQVELDIIVKDGLLIICEIKSSMSKADMVIFDRKVKFYEKKHQRKASGALVILPMVDRRAQAVADNLGIQVYSYAKDIDPDIFA